MSHIFSFAPLPYPLCIVACFLVSWVWGPHLGLLYFSIQHILVILHCSWSILPNVDLFRSPWLSYKCLCEPSTMIRVKNYRKNHFWDSMGQWYSLWSFWLIKVLDTNTGNIRHRFKVSCDTTKRLRDFCFHNLIFIGIMKLIFFGKCHM